MKYHLKNKIAKKELRDSRKKPLPLSLMQPQQGYDNGFGHSGPCEPNCQCDIGRRIYAIKRP